MKQTIIDTLAICAIIAVIGFIFWWAHWDEGLDVDINYRIETPKPFHQPRFIKV